VSREAEVVGREGAVGVNDVVEVTRNIAIIANLVVAEMPQIAAESVEARVPLLEDNRLSLDLTDLLGYYPLGHLLENEKTLLDDLDLLGVANDLVVVDDGLRIRRTIKVVVTIEVIEAGHGADTTPVVERGGGPGSQFELGPEGDGSCKDRRSKDSNDGEFGEHGVGDIKGDFGCLQRECKVYPRVEVDERRKMTVKGYLAKQR